MADFTGSAADDTFNAPATSATTGAAATTVNSGDAINGGAGTDTLNITATAANNNSLTGLTATSIETVNITGANNLGASSPAYAAALDAKALTAATLASKNAQAALSAQQEAAAVQVAALVDAVGVATGGVSANTNPVGELAVVSASTVTATTASQLAAAARAVAALTTVAEVTTASTSETALASGTSYTLAQYNAAALAALKGADGTTLGTGTATPVTERADALALAADAVWVAVEAAASSSDVVEAQKAAAAQAVEDLITANSTNAGDALTAVNGAVAITTGDFALLNTTAFTRDQYVAAAKAVKIAFDGTTAVATNAALATRADELSDFADAVVAIAGDFTVAQLNAAAKAALSSAAGASLLTAGNDEGAIEARADALAVTADEVDDAALLAVTAALNADIAAANAVTVALAGVTATSVAASQFADATAITLSGASSKTNVTAVAATQTIGFSSVSSMENSVTFGSTVAAGSIAASGSSGALTVTGATMASLNVSGTGTGTAGIALTDGGQAVSATGADTIKALNLTTSGSTVITTTGLTALTSVTQTGAGGVTLNSASTATQAGLASVTTGAGADNIRISTTTAVDNLGTTIDETVNASVSTGAGTDRVLVATGGNGKTTVDAGEGSDTVVLSTIGTGANSLSGGAGNDTFRIGALSTIATTTINGGADTDTLRTTQAGTYTATDYTTLVANVSSIETLQLAGAASVTLDASKVAVNRIEFLGVNTNTVTEVSSLQALAAVRTPVSAETLGIDAVTSAALVTNITAASKGYVATDGTVPTVFGDNLNIAMTQVADTATVVAKGNALTLSVSALGAVSSATSGASITGVGSKVTLSGDVVSVTATLKSERGVGSVDAPSALGTETMAQFAIALDSNGETAAGTRTLGNLGTVTVAGAGVVTIDTRTDLASTAATLKTINLSGMTAFSDLNPTGQEWDGTTVGLYGNKSTSNVTLDNDVVETVVLGGAKDTVSTASTYAKADTITGFQLVASAADPLVADASRSDVLKIGGGATALTAANAVKITVTGSTIEAALLQAASATNAAGTARENVVFNFGGDTYFFQDVGANGLDDNDILVKMSGTLDLDRFLTSVFIV